MCLLIVARGLDGDYPVLVASNRDEQRTRRASPPGLHVGESQLILSPRDRRASGTWLAVNGAGLFAGITNVAGTAERADAPSRGHLPHLALERSGIAEAVGAVEREVDREHYNSFQLVLCSREATAVIYHGDGDSSVDVVEDAAVVVSNEHRLGELEIPGLEGALAPGLAIEERLDALAPLLLDEGAGGGHRILKKGGEYGTVSSSLVAVHREDPRQLIWRFAAGPPDEVAYRNYGNLGRRLVPA